MSIINNLITGLKSKGDLNVIFIFMFMLDLEFCYTSHCERRNREYHKKRLKSHSSDSKIFK